MSDKTNKEKATNESYGSDLDAILNEVSQNDSFNSMQDKNFAFSTSPHDSDKPVDPNETLELSELNDLDKMLVKFGRKKKDAKSNAINETRPEASITDDDDSDLDGLPLEFDLENNAMLFDEDSDDKKEESIKINNDDMQKMYALMDNVLSSAPPHSAKIDDASKVGKEDSPQKPVSATQQQESLLGHSRSDLKNASDTHDFSDHLNGTDITPKEESELDSPVTDTELYASTGEDEEYVYADGLTAEEKEAVYLDSLNVTENIDAEKKQAEAYGEHAFDETDDTTDLEILDLSAFSEPIRDEHLSTPSDVEEPADVDILDLAPFEDEFIAAHDDFTSESSTEIHEAIDDAIDTVTDSPINDLPDNMVQSTPLSSSNELLERATSSETADTSVQSQESAQEIATMESLNILKERLSLIEEAQADSRTSTNALDKSNEEIQQDLASTKSELEGLTDKLDKLASNNNNQDEFEKLKEMIIAQADEIASLKQVIGDLHESADAEKSAQSHITEVKDTVSELQASIKTITLQDQEIEGLKDSLKSMQENMETANNTVSELEASIKTITIQNQEIDGLKDSLKSMQDKIETANNTVSELEASIKTITLQNQEIDGLKDSLKSMQDNMETANGTVSELEASVRTVSIQNQEIELLKDSLKTMQDNLETAKETVSELEVNVRTITIQNQEIEVLKDSLRTMQDNMEKSVAHAAAKVIREEIAKLANTL